MIQEFVGRFMANKEILAAQFRLTPPSDYEDLVRSTIKLIAGEEEYDDPDPERVHKIDDGDYQGTLVFVIGAQGYQPDRYWYVKVGYGSCSGCDTLQRIEADGEFDESPNEGQVADYVTLALHIVQGLKEMGDEVV